MEPHQYQAKNEDEEELNAYVDKAWVFRNDDGTFSSVYHESYDEANQALPEIRAKAEGKDVIIKVHCENRNGYLQKVVREIEKLHMSVENISSLPFGNNFLDITITAQLEDEFCMMMEDLKKDLRRALLDHM